MAMGRPTKRSDAVIKRVIEGLSAGTPLTVICAPDDMPADRTVREWAETDAELSAEIARAREAGFDQIALDALAIVDAEPEMAVTEGGTRRDAGYVAWQKARVETRLKLLAKWDPKRYGELLKHGNADGSNIDLAGAVQAAKDRVSGAN